MFSPSNEYSGLISFRNDSFDLLAVQGTLLHNSTVKGNWSQFNTPCMSYKSCSTYQVYFSRYRFWKETKAWNDRDLAGRAAKDNSEP